jgi:DNA-binding NarL/FixJ family response regulator
MRIIALVPDLMDRSRVSSAIEGVEFVGDAAACAAADVVIVDLARHGDAVAEVRAAAPTARIVAFGPHVDDAMLDRARREGADVVLARSRFFADPSAAIGP